MISSNVLRERGALSPVAAPKPQAAAHQVDAPHPRTLVLVITTDKHRIEIEIAASQEEEGAGC